MKRQLISVIITIIMLVGFAMTARAEEDFENSDATYTEEILIDDQLSESQLLEENYYIPDTDMLEDSNVLLYEYMNHMSSSSTNGISLFSINAGDYLTGQDKVLYDYMHNFIVAAAKGEQIDSVLKVPVSAILGKESENGEFRLTKEELGLETLVIDGKANPEINNAIKNIYDYSLNDVLFSLMADCPYELFWYDKVTGLSVKSDKVSMKVSASYIILPDTYCRYFTFYISSDYSLKGEARTTEFDQAKIQSISYAVSNAMEVVAQAAELSDYEKLDYYRGWICANVEYNFDAIEDDVDYGDPWQVIYVFDKDSSTNVVCEGYAKAFQYLCDNTYFLSEDIYCISVDGYIYSSHSNGPHMWNIVHMEDGNNYLVDVTWSDDSYYGERQFFMLGAAAGSVDEGYMYDNITQVVYQYNMKQMVTVYSVDAITMKCGTAYSEESCRVEEIALDIEHGRIGLVLRAIVPIQMCDQYGRMMELAGISVKNTATEEVYYIGTARRSSFTKVSGEYLNIYDIWIPVNAKEIDDVLEIAMYDNDRADIIFSNNNVSEDGHYLCSVMNYIDVVLKDDWSTDNIQETELVKQFAYDMKTYGLCAREYFEYGSSVSMEKLADAVYENVEEDHFALPDCMEYIGSSLVINEYIDVKMYFMMDDAYYNPAAMIFVSIYGEKCELQKISDGFYAIDYSISDLSDLYETQTLILGSGEEGYYISFNVVNYCVKARSQGSDELNNLLNSIALYSSSYDRLMKFYA